MNRFTDLRDKVLPMLRPYVKRIAVFGSFARGEERPESDIDILVELKDPENLPDWVWDGSAWKKSSAASWAEK
jgi:predicted nucleotidyltransferase